jgi:flagellar motor switch protein FliN
VTTPARILDELSTNLASAFEGMTGARPEVTPQFPVPAPDASALIVRHRFSGLPGAIWIAAQEADWKAGGGLVLEAAGIPETDGQKIRSEFSAIVSQALSGVARAVAAWRGGEPRPEPVEEAAPPPGISWSALEINQGATRFTLLAAMEPDLIRAFAEPEPLAGKTPTFDLLLDVELPISVSFGRTEVPLKDVLKLTTGSIVELDRAIGDPVEVIVNGCVIARGEVVTVDGNFGVRINAVVSRQERWKSVG